MTDLLANALPTRRTAEALRAEAAKASLIFVDERLREGSTEYVAAYTKILEAVTQLLALTDDLTNLDAFRWSTHRNLRNAARYIAAPPVSADDFKVYAQMLLETQAVSDLDAAAREILRRKLDPIRFAWLATATRPDDFAKTLAIRWTAGLAAVEQVRTSRRNTASKQQEQLVRALLLECGYREAKRPTPFTDTDALERGTFTRETKVDSAKCDVPVRLHDGRLLLIECKVSNSAVNSTKRLIRETCGKADVWSQAFGKRALTAAVLAGVYKDSDLLLAQNNGVHIFWQHDLNALKSFLLAP